MTCDQCAVQTSAVKPYVYEDELAFAMLSSEPAVKGHIILMPKEHYPILENVPDEIIEHLFVVANKLSIALFESLKAQGTNIMISNGVAAGQESSHFMLNIIPRFENDELDFQWESKHLSQEEMTTVEMQLKEQYKKLTDDRQEKIINKLKEDVAGHGGEEESEDNMTDNVYGKPDEFSDDKEEDYMVKHISRIP